LYLAVVLDLFDRDEPQGKLPGSRANQELLQ
jgi:hypothetical protein